ncbi:relaxase/mobilization nuclease domain-containing protein [Christensenellaceae bacterium OttesenSCG-928-L17]|nr:relaxase/mobilization nuclease domain-containing protein [Christensenellaceae bacterium OttesenSCG-928-L17]
MATSRLIPMHINKGKTIAQCLADRIDYAINSDKTEAGQFVASYGCNASIADAEFLYSKRQYDSITGRKQKNDVIAYQIRQSFKPGEITPELANKIAYDLAMRFTKGNHAFIVCTHTDKKHIHSHIIFNSTAIDCTRKFRNFWGSAKAVRGISDRLCLENGLSIIENPRPSRGHYGTWLGDEKQPSYQDRLRAAIDAALEKCPVDYDAFLALMKQAGYEYKPGKSPGFRLPEQERCTRLRSLKDGYSYDDIRAVISGEKKHVPHKKQFAKKEAPRVNLLVDIQAKLQAGKGVGYERWAKVFNLKQMAQTLNFLQENNLLDYDTLAARAAELTVRFDELSAEIKTAEKRMAEIAVLQTHIVNYSKTRDTYVAYRKAGYSKKFLATHESDIILHKAAKKAFDDAGLKKLPTVKALRSEYAELLASKKLAYGEFVKVRDEKRAAVTAKANVDRLLGMEPARPEQEKDREQR